MSFALQIGCALTLMLSLTAADRAAAQTDYRNRPIMLVLPFEPGGGSDLLARILAQKLGEQTGVSVIVANKPGANGNIAAETVVRATADGHTLLFHTSAIALTPALSSKPGYDVLKDLAPLALTGSSPLVLITHPSVPANTIAEFIRHARATPGKLAYASAGYGNITHLAAFMILRENGIEAVHVPYKGGAPAAQAVAGGSVQFTTQTPSAVRPFVEDKRVRALAVTTLRRSTVLPEVPTLSETAMPNFEIATWQGMMAPAKTPSAIIARLNKEVVKALGDATVRARFQAGDTTPIGSTPEEYGVYLRAEIERWKKVVKSAGVTME